MYYMFYSTNDVFEAEEVLQSLAVEYKIVPTPIREKVYCGVCIYTEEKNDLILNAFKNFEYNVLDP